MGWKEYELEVMRDHADNVVVVCSIENLDPMGVHTGDSITVAPALTLTDREYQRLRDIGIAVIREVGVDTGGCNIQFAVNPVDGRIIVIEMNPRVSRSSALASKATGFPIAKIAAKMAIGYTLDEVPNDITRETPASFEPSLDYVVVKVPRFAFEKFPAADPTLTTTMKSVGEAMSIGRNFTEALQKALRSMETQGQHLPLGRPAPEHRGGPHLLDEARTPHRRSHRARAAGAARRAVGRGGARGHRHRPVVPRPDGPHRGRRGCRGRSDRADSRPAAAGQAARLQRRPDRVTAPDAGGGGARGAPRARGASGLQDGRHLRGGVRGPDALPLQHLRRGDRGRPARAAGRAHPGLGPQPDRPGRRVRLLLRARQLRPARRRLRHGDGQLQPRDRLDRLRHQQPALLRAADPRGRARGRARREPRRPDRRRHRAARRPDPARPGQGAQGRGRPDRRHLARGDRPRRGPRRVRPGAARGRPAGPQARHGLQRSGGGRDRPGDRLPGARAAVVRARRARHGDRLRRRDPRRLRRAGDHREPRAPGARRPVPRRRHRDRRRRALRRHRDVPRRDHGAHRGGRHPLRRLLVHPAAGDPRRRRARPGARVHAQAGPGHRRPRPDERPVRPRPGHPLRARGQPPGVAHRAVRRQGDRRAARQRGRPDHARRDHRRAARRGRAARRTPTVAGCRCTRRCRSRRRCCPFKRFRTKEGLVVDSLLGPEMRSTGEVMGIDNDFGRAFAKAQLGAISGLPTEGTVFVSVANRDKRAIIFPVKRLVDLGFRIVSTSGTADVLRRNSIEAEVVLKHAERGAEGRSIVDWINAGEIDMVVNSPSGPSASARADGYAIRAATTAMDKPIITTVQQLAAAVQAIEAVQARRPRRQLAAGPRGRTSTSTAWRHRRERGRPGQWRADRHPAGRRLPPPHPGGARRRRARPARASSSPWPSAGRRRPTCCAAASRSTRSSPRAPTAAPSTSSSRRTARAPSGSPGCAPTTRSTSSAPSAGPSPCPPSRSPASSSAVATARHRCSGWPRRCASAAATSRWCSARHPRTGCSGSSRRGARPTASRSPPTTAPRDAEAG